jgi:hypothetical protein
MMPGIDVPHQCLFLGPHSPLVLPELVVVVNVIEARVMLDLIERVSVLWPPEVEKYPLAASSLQSAPRRVETCELNRAREKPRQCEAEPWGVLNFEPFWWHGRIRPGLAPFVDWFHPRHRKSFR